MKVRVINYRVPGYFIKGDILGGKFGRRCDADGVAQTLREAYCPAQYLHAAQTSSNHCGPLANPQMVHQHNLASYPIAHRHYRKVGPVILAGLGIDAGRAGAAGAPSKVIQ